MKTVTGTFAVLYCDFHTHTYFSFDGEAESTPEALCRRALEVGMSDICITDHCDIDCEVEGLYPAYRHEEAFAEMLRAKEKFRGRVNLCIGIELGNPHHAPEAAKETISRHPYEFVIGSLHNLKDMPDFCMFRYEMMTPEWIDRLFTQALEEQIELCRFPGIHTLGHVTYMHRYLTASGIKFDFAPYRDRFAALYEELIRRDVALELNVSTLWKGLGISMPTMELLKLYRDCGGRLVTVGSDAHAPQNLGKGIRQGYALLRAAGFDAVTVMRDGQRTVESIV